MANHFIELKPVLVSVSDITSCKHVDHSPESRVRVYKSSPGTVTLQIRNVGPVTTDRNLSGKGMAQKHMIADVKLTASDLRAVIKALQEELAQIHGDDAGALRQAYIHQALMA